MPTYEYETIPAKEGEATKRYEIRQCMSDEPLAVHPETGEAIRRVFSTFNVCDSTHSEHRHGGGCGCSGCACGM